MEICPFSRNRLPFILQIDWRIWPPVQMAEIMRFYSPIICLVLIIFLAIPDVQGGYKNSPRKREERRLAKSKSRSSGGATEMGSPKTAKKGGNALESPKKAEEEMKNGGNQNESKTGIEIGRKTSSPRSPNVQNNPRSPKTKNRKRTKAQEALMVGTEKSPDEGNGNVVEAVHSTSNQQIEGHSQGKLAAFGQNLAKKGNFDYSKLRVKIPKYKSSGEGENGEMERERENENEGIFEGENEEELVESTSRSAGGGKMENEENGGWEKELAIGKENKQLEGEKLEENLEREIPVENKQNSNMENLVENVEAGKNKSPEKLSFKNRKAIFGGKMEDFGKRKVMPRAQTVAEFGRNGREGGEWNCGKFGGENAERCRKWEKIAREMENKGELNYKMLAKNGQCSNVLGPFVLKNALQNALNVAKGSNGKDGVQIGEPPLTAGECRIKLREGWAKLKAELGEQVNLSAAEMQQFGLGNGALKNAFPVDRGELELELRDRGTKKRMKYSEFEEMAEKVIQKDEELPLPEKIIENAEGEWQKVAAELGQYEAIIVGNLRRAEHSQQAIMLSYSFNQSQPNLYNLLVMARKIGKVTKEHKSAALIRPPTSGGFKGLKAKWQAMAQNKEGNSTARKF